MFKAHRLCVSLISRLESNKEEEVPMDALPGAGSLPLPGSDKVASLGRRYRGTSLISKRTPPPRTIMTEREKERERERGSRG